jgi:alkylation response protein AidB-like acyl-CoA dehydrogenase
MPRVASLDDEPFDTLCRVLATHAQETDATGHWPAAQLRLLGDAGIYQWFVPLQFGGQGWSQADLLRAYIALAKCCLATAFILTQRQAAVSRVVASENAALRSSLLPGLMSGETFATVGISHLTTSRRHLARPVLRAERTSSGYRLNGLSPWVTGAAYADHIVAGATLDDAQQLLVAMPREAEGVFIPEPQKLVALSASCTGPVHCENVHVPEEDVLAGPAPEVMKQVAGARTGGLQTSALAIGLSTAAIEFLAQEAERRDDLASATESLQVELASLTADLLELAQGCGDLSADDIRTRANSLALRSTQAALAAAKGAGFVASHPAGRWCREALFFLVWSCPPAVLNANLCELAGISSDV